MCGVQANRWLSLRLELMGESVVFLTAVMASVLLQANAGLAGLAITSSLNMCGFLNWMVRSVSEMEVGTSPSSYTQALCRHAKSYTLKSRPYLGCRHCGGIYSKDSGERSCRRCSWVAFAVAALRLAELGWCATCPKWTYVSLEAACLARCFHVSPSCRR